MIMQAFFRCVVALAMVVPSFGSAQPRADALAPAFFAWLKAHQTTGVLATGALQADGSWQITTHGEDISAPRELASLSKAVTAVCAQHLVLSGDIAWSDSAHDSVEGAPDVTIAELMTHQSGLGPDTTQVAMTPWLGQTAGENGHFSAQVMELVTARPVQHGDRGTYQYNNENYAILGLVIEAVTEVPFFDGCKSRLDLPVGIQPSPRTSVFQPWGGLSSDVTSYLTFLHQHFGPESALADAPFLAPHADMGGGAHYGLGMVFRRFRGSHNFWHFGALCFPNRLNVGSFAVIWEGRVSAVALYDGCLEWEAMSALDTALSRAAYGGGP
ncbi:MAG: serine hydrolase domain-containing protein [Tateyamaria sp.]